MKYLKSNILKSLYCLVPCFVLLAKANIIQTNTVDDTLLISLGKPLVLQCNVSDSPDSNVVWHKGANLVNTTDPRIMIFNDNNSLVIKNPDATDTGKYTCALAKSDGLSTHGDVSAVIDVHMKPIIREWGKSLNLQQGGELRLHCEILTGIPVPSLTWLKDDQPINISSGRIQIEPDDKAPNAILVMHNMKYEDRANYKCLAQNLVGNSSTHILIRVKDKYGALWPFIGICGEVAILCFIIFLYEKKRVNPDFDESDTDQQTENRTIEENQKEKPQDVRQRK